MTATGSKRKLAKRTRHVGQRQRRMVSLSICAPVFVTVHVERIVDMDGDVGDWEVTAVRSADCEISARGVTECMTDAELDDLARLAEAAPDEDAS